MNEIFKAIHDTYNFDNSLSGTFLGNFKICICQNGEIITKEILKAGLGQENFDKHADIILENGTSPLETSLVEDDPLSSVNSKSGSSKMDVIKELMTKGVGQSANIEEYQNTHQDFDFDMSRAVAANSMKIKLKEEHERKLQKQAERD